MELYNNTVQSIKKVDSRIKVGGPSTNCVTCWMDQFLNALNSSNIPIDFISSHQYPSQGKNNVNSYYDQLNAVNNILEKYSKFKSLPFYLSEFNSGLYQWNQKYDNHDSIYASSFMISQIYRLQKLFTNNSQWKYLSYWTFSDIFEEDGFYSPPFWKNTSEKNKYFGMMTIRDIKKPVYNALKLMTQFGSNISYNSYLTNQEINSNNNTVILYCLKNKNTSNRYSIYVSNWNNLNSTISSQTIKVTVNQYIDSNLKQPKQTIIYRIDQNNTNPLYGIYHNEHNYLM